MTTSNRARRVAAGAVIACLALLGAGCSSGSSKAGGVLTVTASPSSASASSPSPSAPTTTVTVTPAATGPAVSPTMPTGIGLCATRDLKITLGLSQGGMGHIYQVIDFTNLSGKTCALYGYPGVSLAGGTPVTQIGMSAAQDPATPRKLVLLAPGAVANALFTMTQAGNYPASTCVPKAASYIQIYPPNQTTPAYIAYSTQACSGAIRTQMIAATRAGA